MQGKAAVIGIAGESGLKLGGSLNERALHFFPDAEGYVGLQGIHAMAEPGLYPLVITGTLPVERLITAPPLPFLSRCSSMPAIMYSIRC